MTSSRNLKKCHRFISAGNKTSQLANRYKDFNKHLKNNYGYITGPRTYVSERSILSKPLNPRSRHQSELD